MFLFQNSNIVDAFWIICFWKTMLSCLSEKGYSFIKRRHKRNIFYLPLILLRKIPFLKGCTAWKESVFGIILVRIFLHSDWIRRDTPYSARMRENMDQNNSEYGHFLRIVEIHCNAPKNIMEAYKFINPF